MREAIYFLFGSDVGSYLIEGNYISIAAVCAAAVLLLCIMLASFSAGKNRRLAEISNQKRSERKYEKRVYIDEEAPKSARSAMKSVQGAQQKRSGRAVRMTDEELMAAAEPMPELKLAERPVIKREAKIAGNVRPVVVVLSAMPQRPVEVEVDAEELPDRTAAAADEGSRENETMRNIFKKDDTKAVSVRETMPPVDEKPGMIPNPMKIPDAPVKTEMDYDLSISDEDDYDIK